MDRAREVLVLEHGAALGPGQQRLQVAERDRVQEHAHPPRRPHRLRQAAEGVGADGGVEGVDVQRDQRDAGLPDALELRLDPRHGAAAIAMEQEAVHSVLGELLRGGEAEPAGAAEDDRPLPLGEAHLRRRLGGERARGRAHVGDRLDGHSHRLEEAAERPARSTSTMRLAPSASAAMLLRQRTVPLICRTSRACSAPDRRRGSRPSGSR
jgi:hypothetical protein